ncbi:unnamed protein product, partial [Linum tenue]
FDVVVETREGIVEAEFFSAPPHSVCPHTIGILRRWRNVAEWSCFSFMDEFYHSGQHKRMDAFAGLLYLENPRAHVPCSEMEEYYMVQCKQWVLKECLGTTLKVTDGREGN